MTSGDAEELVQEIMIVLWHKTCVYDARDLLCPPGFFASPATAASICGAAPGTRTLDETDPSLLPSAEIGADEIIANGDRDAKLRAAVEQLPEEQRDMMRAAFFLGESHSGCRSAR